MKRITEEYIDEVHRELWDSYKKKYTNLFRVPREENYYAGELVRALYVVLGWQRSGSNGNPLSHLKGYSVDDNIAREVVEKHLGQKIQKKEADRQPAAAKGNKAKLEALISNAVKNYGKQFTTEQLAEISGFSAQTVVKHLRALKYYRKIKRGLYEARNPKSATD